MKTLCKPCVCFAVVAMLGLFNPARAATIVWNGASGVDTNWSTAGNWIGGVAPASIDDVRFLNDGADTAPGNVNNTVNSLFSGTVLSLQYAQTDPLNLVSYYHNTYIESGKTLFVLGDFTVGTEAIAAQNIDVAFAGGGTLVISNPATADFTVRQGGDGSSRRATLDLSGLDTFILDAERAFIGRADPPGHPDVNRNTGFLYLAKTNRIKLSNTTAASTGTAIEVGRSRANNGNGSQLLLGQVNEFSIASIGVGMEKETACTMMFNPVFVNPTAKFRGIDGVSRVTFWTIGDAEADSGTTTCRGTNDFSAGAVDALVSTMIVARGGTAGTGGNQSLGMLTFNAGTIDVNTLQIGLQPSANPKWGNGTVNVNGTAQLIVNTTLELANASGGTGAPQTVGRLNINGGTVMANAIVTTALTGNSAITNTSGTLILTNTAGSTAAGLGNLALSDATVNFAIIGATPRIVVTNLTTGGAGNSLVIGLLPAITAYPVQFKLIDYTGSIGGSDFNFTMSGLSGAYTGFLSNNTAGTSVDLVLTAGPIAQNVVWVGTTNGNWDVSTKNWRVGATSTNYFDGDFAILDDTAAGATTINLTTTLLPGSLTVNNSALSYTLTGSGKVGGLSGLTKSGNGTLLLNNTGLNDFGGSIAINAGALQVGNGGPSGNLGSGAISNNASLVVNRSDDLTVPNVIAGTAAGTLTKNGAGVLTVSGANTFTGAVTVATGTLKTGNGAALGRTNGITTINSGATLDVNGQNLGAEPVTVSGSGVGAAGAIVNNGAAQQNALRYVTLAGDTVFGGVNRWDIRGAPSTADPANAALLTGGVARNLTKIGINTIALVGATVDPALANIDVQAGALAAEAATTGLGNPAGTLTVQAGATFQVFNTTNVLNKNFVFNGSGTNNTVSAGDGVITLNVFAGPMSLNGECWMNVNTADFMTFSNSITGGGGASLVKQGGGTLILTGPTKTYAGSTVVSNGTFVLNCNITGGGTLTTMTNTTLSGTGTNNGPVVVAGLLSPGTSAGTFSSGNLTLNAGATVAFELNSVNTIGGGINDLIQVNGNLIVNDNTFAFSLLNLSLQPGTYRLINYTGSLIGNLNTSASLGGLSRYSLTINTNTPGQVNLVVGGTAGVLRWDSTSSTTWDIGVTSNWFNNAISGVDAFFQGDSVLLDDAVGVVTTVDITAGAAVAPSVFTNNSSLNAFTVNGPGKISGGASLYKQGSSVLVMNSTNDFTGVVTIEAGTFQIGNNSALGSTAAGTVIKSGATLDIGVVGYAANTVNIGVEPITVSGSGVSGGGAIINNTGTAQQNAVRIATLVGDTTFGGNGRWDFRGAGAALSTGGNAYNITKVGGNQVTLVAVTVDPALGDIDVQSGTFSIETTTTSAGDPNRTLSVQTGSTLQMFNNTLPLNKRIAFTNGNFNNDSGANVITGPVVLDGSCTFDIDNGTSLAISNVISGPAGSLTKITEAGTLILSGVNTYAGDTVINIGTVALVGAGSLASPNIIFGGAAAILDVGARVDGTLTLGGGRSLVGYGTVRGTVQGNTGSTVSLGGDAAVGRLIVTNAAILNAGSVTTLDVDKANFTNDVVSAASLSYGGTLQLTEISGSPYGAGNTFKLFSAASYQGTFAAISPATPGAGLKWNTNNLAVNGTLKVESVGPLTQPNIVSFGYSGTDVTLVGTGPANGTYVALTSTNVGLPVSGWTMIATGYFDGSGNFNLTTPVSSDEAKRFFLLQVP